LASCIFVICRFACAILPDHFLVQRISIPARTPPRICRAPAPMQDPTHSAGPQKSSHRQLYSGQVHRDLCDVDGPSKRRVRLPWILLINPEDIRSAPDNRPTTKTTGAPQHISCRPRENPRANIQRSNKPEAVKVSRIPARRRLHQFSHHHGRARCHGWPLLRTSPVSACAISTSSNAAQFLRRNLAKNRLRPSQTPCWRPALARFHPHALRRHLGTQIALSRSP